MKYLLVLSATFSNSWASDAWHQATIPPFSAEVSQHSIDLSRWKLTLPVDTELKERPDEIMPTQLSTFMMKDVFYRSSAGTLMLKARCDGIPTKGSSYPRCELREMNDSGENEAHWSTMDAKEHSLTAQVVIHQLPNIKPHVVCLQVHDKEADVIMIRLEKRKMLIEREGLPDVSLNSNYQLGTSFQIRITAGDGAIRIWYNEELRMNWPVKREGCYFKAGCYTQSNLKRGDAADAFGLVEIESLVLK